MFLRGGITMGTEQLLVSNLLSKRSRISRNTLLTDITDKIHSGQVTKTFIPNMSHVMRKPVYAICEQQKRRSACTDPHRLVSAFVVHCLDSIIHLVSISEISSLYLASVAAQAGLMDGWVRVLRPFNSISVILRRWKGEHKRLCAMKCRLGSGRISPRVGFEPATPWSEVGSANRSAMRTLPGWFES